MRVPQLDAAREAHFLLHRELRAYVVRARGVAVEKRLFIGTDQLLDYRGRHGVQIVLSGHMRLAHQGRERWLSPGDCSLQRVVFPDERWEGETFEAVVLEWTPAWSSCAWPRASSEAADGSLHSPRDTSGRSFFEAASGDSDDWSVSRLAAPELARLSAWAHTLVESELCPERAAVHLTALLELLGSAGIPVRRPDPTRPAELVDQLIEPLSPAARQLLAPLSASLSNLGRRPMLVDLESELGRSSRHLRRGLSELLRAYNFHGGSWHSLRHWWRLQMATTLMTARGATTELVGDLLGYGSPRAFCLAMAQANLPSPGRVARAVASLR